MKLVKLFKDFDDEEFEKNSIFVKKKKKNIIANFFLEQRV